MSKSASFTFFLNTDAPMALEPIPASQAKIILETELGNVLIFSLSFSIKDVFTVCDEGAPVFKSFIFSWDKDKSSSESVFLSSLKIGTAIPKLTAALIATPAMINKCSPGGVINIYDTKLPGEG